MNDQSWTPGAIRVFLLDDHEIFRRGLRDLLTAESDIVVAGEASTAKSALAQLRELRPDVAVLDVRLPDGDGISAGESTLDPQASRQLMARLREHVTKVDSVATLSEQEKRVLDLIGEGMTSRQIAQSMSLAEKTAKNYVSSLFTSLACSAGQAALAVRHSR